MFCNNCGKEIPDGSKFCLECGTNTIAMRVSEKQATGATTVDATQREQSIDIVTLSNGAVVDLRKVYSVNGKSKMTFSGELMRTFKISNQEATRITKEFLERHKNEKAPSFLEQAKNREQMNKEEKFAPDNLQEALNADSVTLESEAFIKVCPKCGCVLDKSDDFCKDCNGVEVHSKIKNDSSVISQSVGNVKICPKCGDVLDGRAEFCPTCKTKVKKIAPVSKADIGTIEAQKANASNPNLQLTPSWQQTTPVKKSKRQITKERIKENKANAIACCSKCGSTSLSANKKGFGVGKAVLGVTGIGAIGAVAGNIGAKKLWVTCLNCGNRWKM